MLSRFVRLITISICLITANTVGAEMIRTAVPRASLNYLSIYVAEGKGFFKDEGPAERNHRDRRSGGDRRIGKRQWTAEGLNLQIIVKKEKNKEYAGQRSARLCLNAF